MKTIHRIARTIRGPNKPAVLGWVLPGMVLLVATGCGSASDQSLDSLPWSPTSAESALADGKTQTEANTDTSSQADASELQFRDHVVQACLDDLRRIASEPLVVRAVQEANAAVWQTQEQIEQTDQRWQQTQGVDDPLFQKYLNNPCAERLRKAQRENSKYDELFVMDGKGCIVAESDKTSDYWQGDEPKWIECYHGGDGRIYVGDVEYDHSTRSYVVQISLPIRDKKATTIGALTASVSLGSRN